MYSFAKASYRAVRGRIAQLREDRLQKSHKALEHAFTIPSHLTTEERVALYRLAADKSLICEIGSYVGASACCFGAALAEGENAKGTIFCIDTWANDAMTEGQRDTYAEFTKHTAPYSRHISTVRGWSTEVVDRIAQATDRLDLLFIDGDHSYEGVKADWEAYKRFLRAGSVVVFHDCGWAEGVRRVIDEDAKPHIASWRALPNMWWGVIKN